MTDRSDPPRAAGGPVLARARDLCFAQGGTKALDRLSFDLAPGLTLVRGGEGRGKSTLLRLLAGELPPSSGTLERGATTAFRPDPGDARDDRTLARDWLAAHRTRFVGWDPAREAGLVEGFELAEHLGKGLFMLSTGTRRKLGLVAAFACGASLVLLDGPYGALDGPARGRLDRLFAEASADRTRAWVLADYERPDGLAGVPLAGTIDLGD